MERLVRIEIGDPWVTNTQKIILSIVGTVVVGIFASRPAEGQVAFEYPSSAGTYWAESENGSVVLTIPETQSAAAGRFVLSYTTPTAFSPSQEDRLEVVDLSGANNTWTKPATEGIRLIQDGYGFLKVPATNGALEHYSGDGTLDWSYTPGDTIYHDGFDAMIDSAGVPYLFDPLSSHIYILNPTDGTFVREIHGTYTPSVEAGTDAGIAISKDNSVIFIGNQYNHPINGYTYRVLGVNSTNGTLLWEKDVDIEYTGTPPTGSLSGMLRPSPDSDTIFMASGFDRGGYYVGRLLRLDFPSGVGAAPTVSWAKDWTDATPTVNSRIEAIAVTTDAIYVGGEAADNGTANLHVVVKYDYAGTVLWRHTSPNYTILDGSSAGLHSLGVDNGYVIVGILNDSTTFPNEYWGWKALDPATGVETTIAPFPLETYVMYGAAPLPAAP